MSTNFKIIKNDNIKTNYIYSNKNLVKKISGENPIVNYKDGNYDNIVWTNNSGNLTILNPPNYKLISIVIDNIGNGSTISVNNTQHTFSDIASMFIFNGGGGRLV